MPSPKSVLIIGIAPDHVDVSDPALPPGTTAEKIRAGLDEAHEQLTGKGYGAGECMLMLDDGDDRRMVEALSDTAYDCVIVGGGIRVPPKNLALFERVVNIVHRHAPQAVVAFNTSPAASVEAADRAFALPLT